ncbi:ABC transporter permease [Oryzobacter telluris]|uniref:ABC transporter permease n=1 Tax=Oryzobacter telluris TaxID=3149179 RepID=UPI00370D0063
MTAATAPTPAASLRRRSIGGLEGTGELLRLAFRRDRVLLPASVLGLVLLSVGSAQATLALYPDDASAAAGLGGVLANPGVVALYGPVSAHTADALAVLKTVMMGAFLTAVLGLVVVRRHTRTEEDEGRLELVGAGVVGRRAPLAAAVAVGVVAVLLASGISAAGLVGLGMDARGSVAFGVAWLTAGLASVGMTALAVQLASTTRGAAGLGFGFLGAAYAVRAVGDSVPADDALHALGWLSPLGWAGRVEAFGADRLWVLALGVVALAVGVAAGVAVLDRRDLGAGIIPARGGPERGGRLLSGALGLVVRQARGTVIGWTVGMLVGGVVVGGLLASVADLANDPAVRDMLDRLAGSAGGVEDVYVATEVRFVAAAVAAAGVALVLRLVAAERRGLGELVLATPTSRTRWYAAHVAVALGLPALLMAVLGTTVGIVGPAATPDAPALGPVLGASLATLPAVWVVVGMAALLAGAVPRFAPLTWGVLLVAFVVGELGPTMDLPSWVVDASPFAHVSQLPGGSFEAVPALVLLAVAAALVLAGRAAYLRRDAV